MSAEHQIIILDSHAASHKSLADMLNRLGYTVGHIGSAVDAQSALAAAPQAILFVAVRAAATQNQLAELRTYLPDTRIIAVGARTLDTALAAWRAGADDYLSRPIRDDALIAVLDRVAKLRVPPTNAPTLQNLPIQVAGVREQALDLVHQINNPLTPILGLADLLLDELPANHPGREYAQAILTSAIRIRDVVRALSDSTKQSD